MSLRKNHFLIVMLIVTVAALASACTQQSAGTFDETETPAEPAAQTRTPTPATKAKPAVAETAPAPPAESERPRFVVVNIPAGTEIEFELLDTLSSGTNQVGDLVHGRLSHDLIADGRLVAPAGTELAGTVTEVVPLKKFGGQPSLSFALDRLLIDGGTDIPIVASHTELGAKQAGRDAAKIGGSTAAGAIFGHQIDDDKGKEIGALIGGAIGTAVAAKTGKEVELVAGTLILVALESETATRMAS